jgi:hypothetical protein
LTEEEFDLILLPADINPESCGPILSKAAHAEIAFLENGTYPHELVAVVENAESKLRSQRSTRPSAL